jgi:tripeptidyl-peptidase-1
MVSSGDDGAFSSYARDSLDFCFYTSSFPATSEFVTAVGATMGPESGVVERACDSASGGRITSGGGFALRTQRPSWQDVAVHQYLRLHPFNGSNINAYNTDNGTVFFNEGGRGVPDISLLGFDYEVIIGGNHLGESGTSASAPAFAAMVSLVNAARFRAGKGPIGFLNQILYSLSANFTNDIILGDNSCVAQTDSTKLPNCCTLGGYSAAIGWDPVTGLGSVDFRRFLESLVSLDAVAAEEFPPSSSSDQTIRTLLIVVFTLALIGLGVVGLWLLVKRLRSHTYELFETDDEADVVVVR